MKLIDKVTVVAEIERRLKGLEDCHADRIAGYAGEISGLKRLLSFLDTLEVKEVEEEAVSKDLEEAADKHLVEKGYLLTTKNGEHLAEVEAKGLFKAGAKWQKEQMEKNRIEHCDSITEEQYNLETGFLDDFLDKNKRMPTFLDAIEYGMKKAQKGE